MSKAEAPRPAPLLGYLGLLPFVAGALALWLAPPDLAAKASRALLYYGAVILSFMGAVHWGLAMHGDYPGRDRQLAMSVLPALVAWGALVERQLTLAGQEKNVWAGWRNIGRGVLDDYARWLAERRFDRIAAMAGQL